MDSTNRRVAEKLHSMGELLELTGQNVFKVRAYYRAADVVERLPSAVTQYDERSLEQVGGIGVNIARKIVEIKETGSFRELEELKAAIPASLVELLELEGIGPRTAHTLWQKLGIESIEDLERAARGHRIRAVRGFGEKKEEKFLKSISSFRQRSDRMNRLEAEGVISRVTEVLLPTTFEVAGSYRRGKSTIGDIDIVTTEPAALLNPRLRTVAEEIIDEGEKKTSLRCQNKRVDVRFTRPSRFGSMLLYLTGSKAFNIRMREIALNKGYKLNEYGIEDRSQGNLNTFATEEELFSFLGIEYIVPELREDWGEIEAATTHSLPNLVAIGDIRGDLHVHSNWSDGSLSLVELSGIGEKMGYEYIVCSDHSKTLGIARGLDEGALERQAHEIEVVNRDAPCRLVHGIEVDILADGSLGLPAQTLAELDIVIASVHSSFGQEKDIMTRRVLSAVDSDDVDIIGHPTGRIIGRRKPYEIDLSRVIERASDTGTALECNASPYRLDLDDVYIRESMKTGVKISIGTDSHGAEEFEHMRFGVSVMRRGWGTPKGVLNTYSLSDLLEWAS
ncbi:MAG TPA: DNA polymerase/3'-5' exonuclease PolX [Methanoregulaceae archaeon]|nr:DNA polymerase/3'-5' exonuclease PolX [Methanolinea sp.]MDD3090481.1 DNA polymerase/3'-5' exonuclease PolX [Methanoregulaceae archaeon]MDD5047451.1 DNA polymerase/3'-5' exonuclease PolX [Methanoregulaceae archaeon]MDD5684127.1 DNA polymerase/3'-5' exonuclease PolX [Methanoregulaceae archaeon]HOP66866.1 DNA polymerase/3'-5' exonuclease PolX [Methanoregulaceae archaeon]